jgi:hypothetical protein
MTGLPASSSHPTASNRIVWVRRVAGALAVIGAASGSTSAMAQTVDAAVQSQWFTGSLEAPSPALSKAGLFSVEPYVIYTQDTGTYDNSGKHYSVADNLNQVQSETSIKFAITDRLTVQALPSFAYSWAGHASSTGIGDLPIELEYRFNNENDKTGWPSVTASLGVRLPTGAYDHLNTAIDGLGSGAYTLKEGLLFQSLFDTWGGHPVRLRFYGAAFEAMGPVSVHDISVYGTEAGFQGRAAPGFSGEFGVGAGYALDQRWVLALDVLDNYANATRVSGHDGGGLPVAMRGAYSTSWAVAPAVEYNWSNRIGIIAGVEFTAGGGNTASYFAPQIALSTSF